MALLLVKFEPPSREHGGLVLPCYRADIFTYGLCYLGSHSYPIYLANQKFHGTVLVV
jgi:hypothetical protein